MPQQGGFQRSQSPFLDRVGKASLALVASGGDRPVFVGDAVLALGKPLRGQACRPGCRAPRGGGTGGGPLPETESLSALAGRKGIEPWR